MFIETVTPQLWKVLQTLALLPELMPFRLVGGALSLQLGHRKSIAIDFFRTKMIIFRTAEL